MKTYKYTLFLEERQTKNQLFIPFIHHHPLIGITPKSAFTELKNQTNDGHTKKKD